MASRPELSDTDRELISAYVDGALSADERRALEARLANEPALAAELAEVRALVGLLSDLPPVAPPRDFTLTPETAAQIRREAPRLLFFPANRLVSVLSGVAAALFVLMGAGVLLLNSGPMIGSTTQSIAMEPAADSVQPTQMMPPSIPTIPLGAVGENAARSATGEGAAGAVMPQATAALDAADAVPGEAPGDVEEEAAEAESLELAPESDDEAFMGDAPSAPAIAESAAQPTVTAAPTVTASPLPTATPTEPPAPRRTLPTIPVSGPIFAVIWLVLGAGFLVLSVATIIIRRRGRGWP